MLGEVAACADTSAKFVTNVSSKSQSKIVVTRARELLRLVKDLNLVINVAIACFWNCACITIRFTKKNGRDNNVVNQLGAFSSVQSFGRHYGRFKLGAKH